MTGSEHCEACGETNPANTGRCARCGAPLADRAPGTTGDAGEHAVFTPSSLERNAECFSFAENTERRPPPVRAQPAPPRYAGFVRRAAAFLIDGTILGIFALPLAVAGYAGVRAGLATLGTPAPAGSEDALRSLLTGAWLTMAAVYFTALHRNGGQTIGKALIGIRVLSSQLTAIGTSRSLLRCCGYLLSSSFFGIGFLMVAVTPGKRGWHDYLAGTCVVRLPPDEA